MMMMMTGRKALLFAQLNQLCKQYWASLSWSNIRQKVEDIISYALFESVARTDIHQKSCISHEAYITSLAIM